MAFFNHARNFQGVADILLRDPKRYLAFAQLLDNVMSCESELTQAQRETIALYSSAINGCDYCVDSHASVLTALGASDKFVRSLAEHSTAQTDERMQPLLEFSRKLAREPGAITQADVDSARTAGWSDQAIEDAICVVSTFAFLNRLVDGFGIEGSDTHFKQVGAMVSQQGYGPLVQMIAQKAEAAA